MTSLDQTVKEFLETWAKRKSGILPPVDLRVQCVSCGLQVMGDNKVELTPKGIVCESCFKKPSRP